MPRSTPIDSAASNGDESVTHAKMVRLTLSTNLLKPFLRLSNRLQVERTDLIDLLVMRGWPAELADDEERKGIEKRAELSTHILNQFAEGKALNRFDVEKRIESPVNVTALRMAALREADENEVDPGEGFHRTHMGMDLLDTPEQVWEQARGYWTAQPDAEYLIPVRLGYAPYVFRTNKWTRTKGNVRRIWATSGDYIDVERKLAVPLRDVDDYSKPAVLDYDAAKPANELDLEVAAATAGRIIAFTVGASNPVVRLRQRGHELS